LADLTAASLFKFKEIEYKAFGWYAANNWSLFWS
jgi:hypothetical protein